jgi:hypothetical protein
VAEKTLLVVGGSLFAFLLIEVGCRVCLLMPSLAPPITRGEFRKSCPPPYQGADYFSDDFLKESTRCMRPGPPIPVGYAITADFAGRYINVSNNTRHTTDQPERFTNKVYLFGGSTIFNSEVPDQWTVPSCLQRLLERQSPGRWCVENHGACAMIANQQTERLLDLTLRPGDVVLFYDGVNDVYYPIYNGNPLGWHRGDDHDGGVRQFNATQRFLYLLCLDHKETLASARVLFRLLDGVSPRNLTQRRLKRHLSTAEWGYWNGVRQARAATVRQGGRFYHFLQPHLFSLRKPTAYEQQLIANDLKAMPGLDRAFALGYPCLRSGLASAAKEGLVSFDLTDLFDKRDPGEEYYLDFCHVNHVANQRIAEALFDRVFAEKTVSAITPRKE